MTKDRLRASTKKDLVAMARRKGIAGGHAMTKEQLVGALMKQSKRAAASNQRLAINGQRRVGGNVKKRIKARRQTSAARNLSDNGTTAEEQVERSKFDVGATRDLSARMPRNLPKNYGRDRIVVMVRDPYWLHCYWELTRHSVQRAEAALGQEWHTAKPILRVLDVSSDNISSMAEGVVRDIEIHGGCNNWYIDVHNPPRSFRVDIGYLTKGGRFYVLARSNVVRTPRAAVSDVIDENWADVQNQFEKIYAMSGGFDPQASSMELKQLFEERLRRPMGSPALSSFGSGAFQYGKERTFWFELDAELIVYGATEPNARVTLQGDPIALRPDGTFTLRFSLPENRQIIPAVATSHDGVEERTIVLAIERNTRKLEPLIHNGDEQA